MAQLASGLLARLMLDQDVLTGSAIRVSLHTGPVRPMPGAEMRCEDITWTSAESLAVFEIVTVYLEATAAGPQSPNESPEVPPTGIGDPLAGVLRSIDDVLGQE